MKLPINKYYNHKIYNSPYNIQQTFMSNNLIFLLAFSQLHCYNIRPEVIHVNKDDALITNIQ